MLLISLASLGAPVVSVFFDISPVSVSRVSEVPKVLVFSEVSPVPMSLVSLVPVFPG